MKPKDAAILFQVHRCLFWIKSQQISKRYNREGKDSDEINRSIKQKSNKLQKHFSKIREFISSDMLMIDM